PYGTLDLNRPPRCMSPVQILRVEKRQASQVHYGGGELLSRGLPSSSPPLPMKKRTTRIELLHRSTKNIGTNTSQPEDPGAFKLRQGLVSKSAHFDLQSS